MNNVDPANNLSEALFSDGPFVVCFVPHAIFWHFNIQMVEQRIFAIECEETCECRLHQLFIIQLNSRCFVFNVFFHDWNGRIERNRNFVSFFVLVCGIERNFILRLILKFIKKFIKLWEIWHVQLQSYNGVRTSVHWKLECLPVRFHSAHITRVNEVFNFVHIRCTVFGEFHGRDIESFENILEEVFHRRCHVSRHFNIDVSSILHSQVWIVCDNKSVVQLPSLISSDRSRNRSEISTFVNRIAVQNNFRCIVNWLGKTFLAFSFAVKAVCSAAWAMRQHSSDDFEITFIVDE